MSKEETGKITKSPFPALFPVPVVLVSATSAEEHNIITVAWTGIMCSRPPVLYISLRPETYSHGLVTNSREFVINIPGKKQAWATDYCGMVSGRDVNKFSELGFTTIDAEQVRAPLIKECATNIECIVTSVMPLGSHDAFIARVVGVHFNSDLLDERGKIDIDQYGSFAYCLGEYCQMGKKLGRVGCSRK